MNNIIKSFKESVITNSLSDRKLKEIIKDLKEAISLNQSLINEVNKIDVEKYGKYINIDELKKVVNIYDLELENMVVTNKKVIVKYAGDPYLTIHLIMQALIQGYQIFLATDEVLYGVNEIILSVFENVLKEYSIKNLFYRVTNIPINELKEFEDEIIIIGDLYTYQLLGEKAKFYLYNNTLIYTDCEEYTELRNSMYDFCLENAYEVQIVSEDNIEDAIEYMKNCDNYDVVVLLLKDLSRVERIKNDLKNFNVYINQNPFTNVTARIQNYLKVAK